MNKVAILARPSVKYDIIMLERIVGLASNLLLLTAMETNIQTINIFRKRKLN